MVLIDQFAGKRVLTTGGLGVHLQPAYRDRLRPVVPLRRTEEAAREILSLPMYRELSVEQVERVSRAICTWIDHA